MTLVWRLTGASFQVAHKMKTVSEPWKHHLTLMGNKKRPFETGHKTRNLLQHWQLQWQQHQLGTQTPFDCRYIQNQHCEQQLCPDVLQGGYSPNKMSAEILTFSQQLLPIRHNVAQEWTPSLWLQRAMVLKWPVVQVYPDKSQVFYTHSDVLTWFAPQCHRNILKIRRWLTLLPSVRPNPQATAVASTSPTNGRNLFRTLYMW